jgi:hypothetical protein
MYRWTQQLFRAVQEAAQEVDGRGQASSSRGGSRLSSRVLYFATYAPLLSWLPAPAASGILFEVLPRLGAALFWMVASKAHHSSYSSSQWGSPGEHALAFIRSWILITLLLSAMAMAMLVPYCRAEDQLVLYVGVMIADVFHMLVYVMESMIGKRRIIRWLEVSAGTSASTQQPSSSQASPPQRLRDRAVALAFLAPLLSRALEPYGRLFEVLPRLGAALFLMVSSKAHHSSHSSSQWGSPVEHAVIFIRSWILITLFLLAIVTKPYCGADVQLIVDCFPPLVDLIESMIGELEVSAGTSASTQQPSSSQASPPQAGGRLSDRTLTFIMTVAPLALLLGPGQNKGRIFGMLHWLHRLDVYKYLYVHWHGVFSPSSVEAGSPGERALVRLKSWTFVQVLTLELLLNGPFALLIDLSNLILRLFVSMLLVATSLATVLYVVLESVGIDLIGVLLWWLMQAMTPRIIRLATSSLQAEEVSRSWGEYALLLTVVFSLRTLAPDVLDSYLGGDTIYLVLFGLIANGRWIIHWLEERLLKSHRPGSISAGTSEPTHRADEWVEEQREQQAKGGGGPSNEAGAVPSAAESGGEASSSHASVQRPGLQDALRNALTVATSSSHASVQRPGLQDAALTEVRFCRYRFCELKYRGAVGRRQVHCTLIVKIIRFYC